MQHSLLTGLQPVNVHSSLSLKIKVSLPRCAFFKLNVNWAQGPNTFKLNSSRTREDFPTFIFNNRNTHIRIHHSLRSCESLMFVPSLVCNIHLKVMQFATLIGTFKFIRNHFGTGKGHINQLHLPRQMIDWLALLIDWRSGSTLRVLARFQPFRPKGLHGEHLQFITHAWTFPHVTLKELSLLLYSHQLKLNINLAWAKYI